MTAAGVVAVKVEGILVVATAVTSAFASPVQTLQVRGQLSATFSTVAQNATNLSHFLYKSTQPGIANNYDIRIHEQLSSRRRLKEKY